MLDKDDLKYGVVREGMPIQDIIRLFDAAANPEFFVEAQTRGRMGELVRSIFSAHRAKTESLVDAYKLTMEDVRMIGERLSHEAELNLQELARDINANTTILSVEVAQELQSAGEKKQEGKSWLPWRRGLK